MIVMRLSSLAKYKSVYRINNETCFDFMFCLLCNCQTLFPLLLFGYNWNLHCVLLQVDEELLYHRKVRKLRLFAVNLDIKIFNLVR